MKTDPGDVETQRESPSGRGREPIAAASTVDMPAPVGAFDQPADRFAELGELGRGGMGRVVDAYDRALGRSVAVKTILSTDETDLARFEREAQITARLEHPGIVPIHDAGRDAAGQPYYVMRKVDGRPLSELVDPRQLHSRLALVPNVLAACDAVAFAHARRVIHRDIKPTNILVGPFGETLVIDWGLARAYDLDDQLTAGPAPILDSHPELTRAGAVAGTPGFMSPEQARGEPIDARADVYALGATLYYVLTGKLAFRTTSATEIMTKVGANQDADWSQLDESTPADLVAILKKAMSPKADARYSDAGELAADLRQYVTGKLVGARDYAWYEQLGRFASRHKPVIAVAVAALIIIGVGATLSVQRVIAERDTAETARAVALAGQREATDKRDELLVRHAMDLVEGDPAAAIAVLRRLPIESTQWRAASVVASAASARGIPRGYDYPGRVQFVAFSPSGQRLLVRLMESALWVQEVASGERTLIGTFAVGSMQWMDERTIVAADDHAIAFIDTETSAVRMLPTPTRRPSFALLGDGTGYIVAESSVYLFDGTTQVLGAPVATGLEHAAGVAGHGVAHRVGSRIYLLTPAGDRELPGDYAMAPRIGLTGLGSIVVARSEGQSCVWDPAPGGASYCAENVGLMVMVGRMAVVARGQALVGESSAGGSNILYAGATPGLFPTSNGHGAIGLTERGTIFLAFPTHSVELPPRPPGYSRAITSLDDRYVAAVAGSEVMIYDLAQLSLVAYTGPGSLEAVTRTSIWSIHMLIQVNRVGPDGMAKLVPMPDGAYAALRVDDAERWLIAYPGTDAVTILRDLTSGKAHKTRPLDMVAMDQFPVIIGADGKVWSFRSGSSKALPPFDGRPIADSVKGDWLATALRDGRICRTNLATEERTCTALPGLAESVVVNRDGEVWIAVGAQLWHWDGVLLTHDDLSSPVVGLTVTDNYVVALVGNGMFVHDGRGGRLLPISVDYAGVASDDRLVTRGANGRLRIVDVPTGLTYDLFTSDMVGEDPVVRGSSIAFQRPGNHVFRFELTVPTEPVALRKWLADVTNLVEVPDSEVVAWPTVTDP